MSIKSQFISRMILPLVMLFIIAGCKKELSGSNPQQAISAGNSGAAQKVEASSVSTRIISFTPTAVLMGCIGYNIRVFGNIELKETNTTDGQGHVHYTRHWSVKGLEATATLSDGTVLHFDVVAGTEMFSVKDPNTTTGVPNAVLSGEVFIHQGTIVFVNKETGERIVARHEVLKVPGQTGIFKNGWYIQGQKCS